jgi:hypothetical protein
MTGDKHPEHNPDTARNNRILLMVVVAVVLLGSLGWLLD